MSKNPSNPRNVLEDIHGQAKEGLLFGKKSKKLLLIWAVLFSPPPAQHNKSFVPPFSKSGYFLPALP
jgi:hypothetical protein